VVWSPTGDEVWFSASSTGSANNLRAVSLAGKTRTIANVPGGMWIHDIRNGVVLAVTQHDRLGIRGVAPGSKDEQELGWLGWSELRAMSADGKKILFEEESEGGGPNYTVFLRDTDGSPPVRIGEGLGIAISPDNKWVITKPAKGGPLNLVPTGAGQGRQLTHDNVTYASVEYLPDGKHLLASGIEADHGARDYLIDLTSGDAKPITPEGTAGVVLSPDGSSTAVVGPDGNLGIWPLSGSGMRPIPGLDNRYHAVGWSPDGKSLYVLPSRRATTAKASRVDVATGKVEDWKTFGTDTRTGIQAIGNPRLSKDGSAYAYVYAQVLSQAYVVKGLK
jgi:Tol biopolymer transport system component